MMTFGNAVANEYKSLGQATNAFTLESAKIADRLDAAIERIDDLAKRAGGVVERIVGSSSPVDKPGLSAVRVSSGIMGRLDNIVAALDRLESALNTMEHTV